MKIIIDETVCNNKGLSLSELFLVLAIKNVESLKSLISSLLEKEIIISDGMGDFLITQRWNDVTAEILLDSEAIGGSDESLTALASSLMQVFPKGKKPETNVYWRGNLKDIKLRLKKFYKLYGSKYTSNDIIKAAQSYVSSFNSNYSKMRVLKYFIWKDAVKMNAEGKRYIEEVSDLATILENNDNDSSAIKDLDWTTRVI